MGHRSAFHAVLPIRFWLLVSTTVVALLGLRFGLNTTDRFADDVSAVNAYIQAIGVLYGIVAAFTIYVVWGQFNDCQEAVDEEAAELAHLSRYAALLKDDVASERIRWCVANYASAVIDSEWSAMARKESAKEVNRRFDDVIQAANSVSVSDRREASIFWPEIVKKIENASDFRIRRLYLAATRVPAMLRILLYVASAALISGFLLLAIEDDFVAAVMTVATTAVVFLAIEVFEDLDNPFVGHWVLKSERFSDLLDSLREDQSKGDS
jgi:hypothetical protein